MARRLPKTLADYMVISISPVLIMFLVGSLLFFLLTAFYHGQYEARLSFIFALFVMAAVLIARISMERGIEYAAIFAIALAIVTGLAVMRFVRINGALAGYSTIINWSLIALVWWSAHKLTWDCTLIDEQEDSSGEGLLQGMGFDEDTVAGQAELANREGEADESERPPAAEESDLPHWMQRMVDRRRRPHTPGVWVVYFSMAALPLFGLGQWFIPSTDTASRMRAFQLLFVYVASALGLLLTTSFLGLRRYLRQRHLQMPGDMAGVWLGIGGVMVVALLLFCILLPRPGAAVSISQLPLSFGSPDHRRTQKHAFGNDGPEDPDRATRTRDDAQKSGKSAPQKPGAKRPSSAASRDSKRGKSAGGSKGNEQGAEDSGPSKQRAETRPSSTGDQAGKRQADGNTERESSKSNPNTDRRRESQADGRRQDRQSSSEESKQGDSKAKGDSQSSKNKTNGRESQQDPTGRQERPANDANRAESGKGGKTEKQRDRQRSGPKFDRQDESSSAESRRKSPAKERSSNRESSSPRQSVTGTLGKVAQGFGTLLKLLFFALVVCAVGFFAWKYRDQVRAAWTQLIEDLKNLWARLFGRQRPAAEDTEVLSEAAVRAPVRPFSSFADPFATGTADRYSTEQLVQYSFEALEAWAREQGCPHENEETPIEFARFVAMSHPNIGPEAHKLADLYCRVAYGHEPIAARNRDFLRRIWRRMRAPVPPPVPASD